MTAKPIVKTQCENFTCPKCGGHRLARDLDVVERAPITKLEIGKFRTVEPVLSEDPEEYEYFEAEDCPYIEYWCLDCYEYFADDYIVDLLEGKK